MKRLVALLALFASLHAQAQAQEAMLDCATSLGVEMNPLGAVGACALKWPMMAVARDMPEPDRTAFLQAQRTAWAGAAVNNLMVLAGAGAAAPVFGVMFAVGVWASGAERREFARLCAVHEQLAGHAMTCIYTAAPKL